MFCEAVTFIARYTAYNIYSRSLHISSEHQVSKLNRQLPAPGTGKVSSILKLGSNGQVTMESGDDPVLGEDRGAGEDDDIFLGDADVAVGVAVDAICVP